MSPILEINHAAKKYPNGERPYIFSNVTVKITQPVIIAVLGASGQGKSTLLRILARLENVDEGSILLNGVSSSDWLPNEWRKKVSYVAQQPVMLDGSVERNLKTVSFLHQLRFDKELAMKLLDRVGLQHLDWNKNAQDLSGGEKQRVALIRSLLLRSEILLLDEVTSSLDIHSKQLVEDALKEWHAEQGTTLVWVTHDLKEAREYSDRVWFLADGALIEDTDTASFFASPRTKQAKHFIHSDWGDV